MEMTLLRKRWQKTYDKIAGQIVFGSIAFFIGLLVSILVISFYLNDGYNLEVIGTSYKISTIILSFIFCPIWFFTSGFLTLDALNVIYRDQKSFIF